MPASPQTHPLWAPAVLLVLAFPVLRPAASSGEEIPELERRDVPRVNLPPYPRVFRNFMPEAGPSAFAVELAESLTLIYDPLRGGINAAWIGEIDLAPTVQAKINDTAEIVGEVFYRETMRQPLRRAAATGEEPERRFKGYRYEEGAVVFESTIDGFLVAETLRALPDGRGFERTIAPEPGGEALVLLSGALDLSGAAILTEDRHDPGDQTSWPASAEAPLVLRISAAGEEGEEGEEPASAPRSGG